MTWVLLPGWAGFIGPGPFTDDEFKDAVKAYAEAGGWAVDDVLANQRAYAPTEEAE